MTDTRPMRDPVQEEYGVSDDLWDILQEYGNTEEELDEFFAQPWPGQPGYQGDEEDQPGLRIRRAPEHDPISE